MKAIRIGVILSILLVLLVILIQPILALRTENKIFIPVAFGNYRSPGIEFTFVPPCRSFETLKGKVENIDPSYFKVAVYIFVSGWWTKPYWASPLTTINSDGTWTCYITTGGNDPMATKVAAFVVPSDYGPPLAGGDQNLPAELYQKSPAYKIQDRQCQYREITFSGRTWLVKATVTPAGPGPNYFSDDTRDVWVDQEGKLHLKIIKRNNRWHCTEVITKDILGYGKYVFRLSSRIDQLDKNVVLGLFTWDDTSPDFSYREIDTEFSRWSQEVNDNSQYVVQPWNVSGNMFRFNAQLTGNQSTHGFNWQPNTVFFQSLFGHQTFPGPINREIRSWTYTGGSIPPTGNVNARINLWLFNGTPPSNDQEVEIVVDSFEYIP